MVVGISVRYRRVFLGLFFMLLFDDGLLVILYRLFVFVGCPLAVLSLPTLNFPVKSLQYNYRAELTLFLLPNLFLYLYVRSSVFIVYLLLLLICCYLLRLLF